MAPPVGVVNLASPVGVVTLASPVGVVNLASPVGVVNLISPDSSWCLTPTNWHQHSTNPLLSQCELGGSGPFFSLCVLGCDCFIRVTGPLFSSVVLGPVFTVC